MDSCRTWACGWRKEHFVSGHFCIRICNFWKKFYNSFIPCPSPVPRILPVCAFPVLNTQGEPMKQRCFLYSPWYCAWQSYGILLCLKSSPPVECSSRLVKTRTLRGQGFMLVTGSRSCASPAAPSEHSSAHLRKARPYFMIIGIESKGVMGERATVASVGVSPNI